MDDDIIARIESTVLFCCDSHRNIILSFFTKKKRSQEIVLRPPDISIFQQINFLIFAFVQKESQRDNQYRQPKINKVKPQCILLFC